MVKVYTAQEMREMAFFFERNADQFSKARSNSVLARIPETIAMLGQAADALEHEERSELKYEYAAKYDGGFVSGSHFDTANGTAYARAQADFASVVRRPVGEWEEVKV